MKKVRSKLHPTEIGVIKTFSLSPDDEVGEIAVECSDCIYYYNNLRELCEKWEDYEEPKAYYIGRCGTIEEFDPTKDVALTEMLKKIGNYFETEEEIEKAVKKIIAWTRLKDKGFEFQTTEFECSNLCGNGFEIHFWATMPPRYYNEKEKDKDLDLLFGVEE